MKLILFFGALVISGAVLIMVLVLAAAIGEYRRDRRNSHRVPKECRVLCKG